MLPILREKWNYHIYDDNVYYRAAVRIGKDVLCIL